MSYTLRNLGITFLLFDSLVLALIRVNPATILIDGVCSHCRTLECAASTIKLTSWWLADAWLKEGC